MSVAQKLFFHIAVSILILLPLDFLWSYTTQADSLIKKMQKQNSIIGQDLLIIPNYLFTPEKDRPYINNLDDLLITTLKKDYLNQRLYSDYIFQSPLSEQWRINEQLTNYIQFKNELSLKSELGVFGKVLGNSRKIAVLILAILHVIKYKKGLY